MAMSLIPSAKKKLQASLRKFISGPRYTHSLRTAVMAEKLALLFKENPEDAYLAGLFHDCARNLPPQELINQAKIYRIKITTILKENPVLLHGPVGACWANAFLGIKKTKISQAISRHIVGAARMSTLDKIIFIADYIEDSRLFPAAKKIRTLIFKNKIHPQKKLLNLAVQLKAQNSLAYAYKKNWQIHPSLLKLASKKI